MDTFADGRPMRESFYVWRDCDGWHTPLFAMTHANLMTLAVRAWNKLNPTRIIVAVVLNHQTIDHCDHVPTLLNEVYQEIEDRLVAGLMEPNAITSDLRSKLAKPYQLELVL